jgi:F420H(2)-dependent quinone reductase
MTEQAGTRPAVERVTPPLLMVRMVNPVLCRLLASPLHGLASRQLLLLHFSGRRTGRRYTVPVGYHDLDGVPSVLTNSGWRVNFRGGADIEVTLRGRRRPARATLVEDPETVATAYQGVIDGLGWQAAQRRLGIRVNVGRAPTRAELTEAVRTSGLSIVRLDLR